MTLVGKSFMREFLVCLTLFAVMLCAGPRPADAAGTASYSGKEIVETLAGPRNVATMNRLTGLITDLLRAQKSAFTAARGERKNDVAITVEGLINEASLSASQGLFDEGFATMEKA